MFSSNKMPCIHFLRCECKRKKQLLVEKAEALMIHGVHGGNRFHFISGWRGKGVVTQRNIFEYKKPFIWSLCTLNFKHY